MDTELLRSFVAVARTRSFTAAARELGYVQSTVTGHVAALERAVGARLFDRLPSGSTLTDAGERVQRLTLELLDLEQRVLAAGGKPAPATVRIAASESQCAYRLPELVTTLSRKRPELRIAVLPAGTAAALDAVRDGGADLGLVVEPTVRAPGLDTHRLGAEPVTLVTAPEHAASRARTWRRLAEHDALLLEEGCSYADEAAARLAAAGQPAGRLTRFGSIEAIKRCVAAGLGWTVLPRRAVEGELADGQLVSLAAPTVRVPNRYLVRHPRRTGAALDAVGAALAET